MGGFLPASEHDLDDTRCWLAWAELARSEPVLGAHVARAEDDEQALLALTLHRAYPDPVVAVVHATLQGLRHAVVRTDDPLPVSEARELLAASAEALLRLPESPPPPPPAAG